MLIGAHVSVNGGVENAPKNAYQAGCECFQMFTRSPHGGKPPPLTETTIKRFKQTCSRYKLQESYIHTPYYINLASKNNRIYYGSISVIRDDLERGSLLGVKYLMTHLGSARDMGEKMALKKVAEGIAKILDGYQGTTQFLIEMSSGAGQVIGDSFEEIKTILSYLKPAEAKRVGVCFDTCHVFTSGYDLRSKEALEKTLKKFDSLLGIEKLKLIHANDSKADLGSHIDRHEHIGAGKIGMDGFRALVKHHALKKLNLVIETPKDGKDINDIKILKNLRDGK